MSSVVQIVIGSLLLSAGLISVIAAILGNPIRLGRAAIPGPNGGPARAVVAGIGTASLAACALVFILGPTDTPTTEGTGYQPPPPPTTAPPAAQGDTGSSSGSIGGLPALTPTPTPTGSPKPPTAPSSAPPVPGKPTVTLIKVTGNSTATCDQTYQASVNVANGPVTLTYVISVDGTVRGPNPRTATVKDSTAILDLFTVDLRNPGEIVYNVLAPNTVSDNKTWTVPVACQKAVSVTTPQISGGPQAGESCTTAPLRVQATLKASPSPAFNVTYHLEINGKAEQSRTESFTGSTPIADTVALSNGPGGNSKTVRYVVTAPVSVSSSEVTFTSACTSPAPPEPTDDPSTSVAAPTSDVLSEPADLPIMDFTV